MGVGGNRGGIPSDRVVAVVAYLDTGRVQTGSGYLVTARHVITARHCTVDQKTGRSPLSLRVIRRSDGAQVTAELFRSEADAAVITVAEDPDWVIPTGLQPPRFGRVDRSRSGELTGCEAVGFPLWQLDPGEQRRNAAELHGTVRLTEDAESGFMVLRDPLLADVTVPPSVASDDRAEGSAWGGLSGALVFYHGTALGVVVEHHPRQGRSAVTILPVDRFASILTALGLPPARPLAMPPYPPGGPGLPVDVALKDPEQVFALVDVEAFTGREWLMDEVDGFVSDSSCGYVWLEAEAGVGKTAFAAWLVRQRGYLSHFSLNGRSTQAALANLAAQLIRTFELTDVAPWDMLPEWVQEASGFEALLNMAAEQARAQGRRVIMVVDGLDEAELPDGGLPFGLPPILPESAYVIGTYRTGRPPRRLETPTITLRIDPDGPRNKGDIRTFLARVLAEGKLASLFASVAMDSASFADVLAERCGGVWVYLKYVLGELRTGLRHPEAIDEFPFGLWGYYADQIDRWKSKPGWADNLLPLLTVLGVAREPLHATALAQLANVDLADVRRCCDITLRPFLAADWTAEVGGYPRYEIYHSSFREALRGKLGPQSGTELPYHLRVLAAELGSATTAAHARVARRYLTYFGGLDAGLQLLAAEPLAAKVDDGYPLRHLVHHLRNAAEFTDLHRLLMAEHAGRNVWHEAHDRAGDTEGYLADVQAARQAAEEATDTALKCGKPAESIGLEIRYALITASLAARAAALPPDLIVRLVQTGAWSRSQGLAYGRQIDVPGDLCVPRILSTALTSGVALPVVRP